VSDPVRADRVHEPRATLRDVAALAGVSTKTASRVVNGEPGVVPAKVDAVTQAIEQLNYRRDMSASSLRRSDGRTAAVAALLEDLANPYSAEVHRALENEAYERGVLIFAGSVDQDPERERQLVREFAARRADGLVIMPASTNQAYLAREVPARTPIVFVDRTPVGFAADAVVTDNSLGAARAVAHLVRHGHRRIGFLGDKMSIDTARERHDGFLRAMAEHGLTVPPGAMATELHTREAAARAAHAMFNLPEPPTAIFTAQNNITIAGIRCLQELGLTSQVALVGFDDLPWADLVQPGITVMAQDPTAIGRRAAQIMFARLGGDDSTPFRAEIIPTRLIERGSGEIPRLG
jgi:LacI family transcriptional regulator